MKDHPIFFHLEGFPPINPNVFRKLVNTLNLLFYHSKVNRRFLLRTVDNLKYNLTEGLPNEFRGTNHYNVYIEKRDRWGGYSHQNMTTIFVPQVTDVGYDFWELVRTIIHEFAHDMGVAVWPTSEVYNLQKLEILFPNILNDRPLLKNSPMNKSRFYENPNFEWLLRNNIFAPVEAAILNGNFRMLTAPLPYSFSLADHRNAPFIKVERFGMPGYEVNPKYPMEIFSPANIIWPPYTLALSFNGVPVTVFDVQQTHFSQNYSIQILEDSKVYTSGIDLESLPYPELIELIEETPEPIPETRPFSVKVTTLGRDFVIEAGPCEFGSNYALYSSTDITAPSNLWKFLEQRVSYEENVFFLKQIDKKKPQEFFKVVLKP